VLPGHRLKRHLRPFQQAVRRLKGNAVHFEGQNAYGDGPSVMQDRQPWPVFLLACRPAFV
ncbi:hypothetical protein, partial [Paracraurococcus lichenis]